MANISDIIENFIIKTMGDEDTIDISRNQLAEYFSCAPSQINYCLETRFTVDRGYVKTSKRGGSGFIKISKIKLTSQNEYITTLLKESVGEDLSEKRLEQILQKLNIEQIISEREADIILVALSDDSLAMPLTIKDKVRAKAFKNVLLKLMVK